MNMCKNLLHRGQKKEEGNRGISLGIFEARLTDDSSLSVGGAAVNMFPFPVRWCVFGDSVATLATCEGISSLDPTKALLI